MSLAVRIVGLKLVGNSDLQMRYFPQTRNVMESFQVQQFLAGSLKEYVNKKTKNFYYNKNF